MTLFSPNSAFREVKPSLTVLKNSSPAGEIIFNARCNGNDLLNMAPSQTYLVNERTDLIHWDSHDFQAEFIKLDIAPFVPENQKTDQCICGVWRLKALRECSTQFMCTINFKDSFDGGPDTGECLFAQTWDTPLVKISMGTEDEECFKSRAYHNCWMPPRFEPLITLDWLLFLDNGLQVNFPPLQQNDCIQVQFIIAWVSQPNNTVATWLAVDQFQKNIYQYAGLE